MIRHAVLNHEMHSSSLRCTPQSEFTGERSTVTLSALSLSPLPAGAAWLGSAGWRVVYRIGGGPTSDLFAFLRRASRRRPGAAQLWSPPSGAPRLEPPVALEPPNCEAQHHANAREHAHGQFTRTSRTAVGPFVQWETQSSEPCAEEEERAACCALHVRTA